MSKRPNLVLIFADQMHKYALGKLDSQFHTPHLERLCKEGALFEDAYSSNPICGPCRGCLMTGLSTSRSRGSFQRRSSARSNSLLAATLAQTGYAASFVRKWRLGSNRDGPIPLGPV